MTPFDNRRVRRNRKGEIELRLPQVEREVIASVVGQLREVLLASADAGGVDPTLRRLFPTAYADDAEREAEYQGLVHDDLRDRRLVATRTLLATVEQTKLDEEQVLAWMTAVNDVRLVLGTQLDVSEDEPPDLDPDDPEAPAAAVYEYLGHLLIEIVDALQP